MCCAGAGKIETRDGKSYQGEVKLADGKLHITAESGETSDISIDEVSRVALTPPPATQPATQPFVGIDVGPIEPAGKSNITDQRINIVENGRGLGTKDDPADSFHYVYQRLKGDGALIARVRSFQDWRFVKLGVMLRPSLNAQSTYVALARGQVEVSGLLVRADPKSAYEVLCESDKRILGSAWLRLERKGYAVTASESADGKAWKKIGEANLSVGPDEEIFAGVFAASSPTRNEANGKTTFDHVQVIPAAVDPSPPKWPRGMVTRGGSVIASDIVGIEEGGLTLSRSGKGMTVQLAEIARLQFVPLVGALGDKAQTSRAGVLLQNGDFVEGEFKRMDKGRVTIASLLFGDKSLEMKREAAALVLREAKQGECAFEVMLLDGSRVRAKSISIQGDDLVVEDALVGKVPADLATVLEIRRIEK